MRRRGVCLRFTRTRYAAFATYAPITLCHFICCAVAKPYKSAYNCCTIDEISRSASSWHCRNFAVSRAGAGFTPDCARPAAPERGCRAAGRLDGRSRRHRALLGRSRTRTLSRPVPAHALRLGRSRTRAQSRPGAARVLRLGRSLHTRSGSGGPCTRAPARAVTHTSSISAGRCTRAPSRPARHCPVREPQLWRVADGDRPQRACPWQAPATAQKHIGNTSDRQEGGS